MTGDAAQGLLPRAMLDSDNPSGTKREHKSSHCPHRRPCPISRALTLPCSMNWSAKASREADASRHGYASDHRRTGADYGSTLPALRSVRVIAHPASGVWRLEGARV